MVWRCGVHDSTGHIRVQGRCPCRGPSGGLETHRHRPRNLDGDPSGGGRRSEAVRILHHLAGHHHWAFGSAVQHHQGMVDSEPETAPSAADVPLHVSALGSPLKHLEGVWALAWVRDGDGRLLLATCSGSGEVRIWEVDPSDGRLSALGSPFYHPDGGGVRHMAWAQDGDGRLFLATGSTFSRKLGVWEVDPADGHAKALSTPLHETYGVRAVAWARDGSGRLLLATTNGDEYNGEVSIWEVDPAAGRLSALGSPLNQPPAVGPLAWVRDGNGRLLLAAGSWGNDGREVWIWEVDPADGGASVLCRFDCDLTVTSLAWARDDDGRLLLAASLLSGAARFDEVRIWEVDPAVGHVSALGSPLNDLVGASSLAWARDGNGRLLLAAGGSGIGRAEIWEVDPASGRVSALGFRSRHPEMVWAVAWARDSDGRLLLATCRGDERFGETRIWEVTRKRLVQRRHFRSDVAVGKDELGRVQDARAVAELVAAPSVRPPLAVGLFGEWGEGKSHFLDLIQRELAELSEPAAPTGAGRIRQVRFNAWHYAESSLWASLVAELFRQLAADEDAGPEVGQRRLSRLSAELLEHRGTRRRLAGAKERLAALEGAGASRSAAGSLSQADIEDMARATGLRPEEATRYARLRPDLGSLRAGVVLSWITLRAIGWRRLVALLAVTAALCALGFATSLVWPVLHGWWASPPLLAFLLLARSVLPTIRRARQQGLAALHWLGRVAEEQRDRLAQATEAARAEVAALEREVRDFTAAGQLAGLVADKAAAGDYRGQLGIMTQIREDFAHMARLLADTHAQNSTDTDAADDQLPQIHRIVLYIDDLDRCPPARVVELLEAIHLLLAVNLFVVVVAIDPRWMLRAVTAHYRDVLDAPRASGPAADPDEEALWQASPAQYLEKIFQVVLTLPAMDQTGYQRLLRSVQATPTSAALPATPIPADSILVPTAIKGVFEVREPSADSTIEPQDLNLLTTLSGADENQPLRIQAVVMPDPFELTAQELDLLDLLGPPLLVRTPRSVKRLSNSYGLLTAMRSTAGHRNADLRDQPYPHPLGTANNTAVPHTYRPHRAGMVLLATLTAYPTLGPALSLHLHHQATEHPTKLWSDFCSNLNPANRAGLHSNAANQTQAQTAQWTALHHALLRVTHDAAERGVPLPAQLGCWREWVAPVARLSFPAGRIVNDLAQKDHTSTVTRTVPGPAAQPTPNDTPPTSSTQDTEVP
ncbi:P-loop NTPase fold protein [Streptomyces sp. NPDC047081]|uniref:P-loop NTPase fold protein n=1 Tax=Streptomyces sp. NPDC047081 TaxID=3154706 RepID=UPI0033F6D933